MKCAESTSIGSSSEEEWRIRIAAFLEINSYPTPNHENIQEGGGYLPIRRLYFVTKERLLEVGTGWESETGDSLEVVIDRQPYSGFPPTGLVHC
jgi:hypothetical protein